GPPAEPGRRQPPVPSVGPTRDHRGGAVDAGPRARRDPQRAAGRPGPDVRRRRLRPRVRGHLALGGATVVLDAALRQPPEGAGLSSPGPGWRLIPGTAGCPPGGPSWTPPRSRPARWWRPTWASASWSCGAAPMAARWPWTR